MYQKIHKKTHTDQNQMVVSNIFYFDLYLRKIPILTNIFQMGWFNHHPEKVSSWNQKTPKIQHLPKEMKPLNSEFDTRL